MSERLSAEMMVGSVITTKLVEDVAALEVELVKARWSFPPFGTWRGRCGHLWEMDPEQNTPCPTCAALERIAELERLKMPERIATGAVAWVADEVAGIVNVVAAALYEHDGFSMGHNPDEPCTLCVAFETVLGMEHSPAGWRKKP